VKIIAFNGPPRCGKDTTSNLLADYIKNRSERLLFRRALSMPLRLMVFGAIQQQYSEQEYERLKDQVIPALGVTMRQFQIDISEKLMKPVYRSDIMPLLMIQSVPSDARAFDPLVIVSDLGFPIEVSSLALHVGVENLAIVRVHREGSNFNNDSRRYVESIPERTFDIDNNDDLERLNHSVIELAEGLNRHWNI